MGKEGQEGGAGRPRGQYGDPEAGGGAGPPGERHRHRSHRDEREAEAERGRHGHHGSHEHREHHGRHGHHEHRREGRGGREDREEQSERDDRGGRRERGEGLGGPAAPPAVPEVPAPQPLGAAGPPAPHPPNPPREPGGAAGAGPAGQAPPARDGGSSDSDAGSGSDPGKKDSLAKAVAKSCWEKCVHDAVAVTPWGSLVIPILTMWHLLYVDWVWLWVYNDRLPFERRQIFPWMGTLGSPAPAGAPAGAPGDAVLDGLLDPQGAVGLIPTSLRDVMSLDELLDYYLPDAEDPRFPLQAAIMHGFSYDTFAQVAFVFFIMVGAPTLTDDIYPDSFVGNLGLLRSVPLRILVTILVAGWFIPMTARFQGQYPFFFMRDTVLTPFTYVDFLIPMFLAMVLVFLVLNLFASFCCHKMMPKPIYGTDYHQKKPEGGKKAKRKRKEQTVEMKEIRTEPA